MAIRYQDIETPAEREARLRGWAALYAADYSRSDIERGLAQRAGYPANHDEVVTLRYALEIAREREWQAYANMGGCLMDCYRGWAA